MKVYTFRDSVKDMYNTYKARVEADVKVGGKTPYEEINKQIYADLGKLDLDTCLPDEINKILNKYMTTESGCLLMCSQCGEYVEKFLYFEITVSHTYRIPVCEQCLEKALKFIKEVNDG